MWDVRLFTGINACLEKVRHKEDLQGRDLVVIGNQKMGIRSLLSFEKSNNLTFLEVKTGSVSLFLSKGRNLPNSSDITEQKKH